MWIINIIKSWFCKHEYEFVRNIHGDEINWCGGYRSIWRCKKCGNIQYREELNPIGSLFCQMLNRKYDKYYEDKFKDWQEENKSSIEDIKKQMIKAAEQGKCWLDIVLFIDENKSDRYYWEKTFDELGIKFDRENLPKEYYQIYKLTYHLKWKKD